MGSMPSGACAEDSGARPATPDVGVKIGCLGSARLVGWDRDSIVVRGASRQRQLSRAARANPRTSWRRAFTAPGEVGPSTGDLRLAAGISITGRRTIVGEGVGGWLYGVRRDSSFRRRRAGGGRIDPGDVDLDHVDAREARTGAACDRAGRPGCRRVDDRGLLDVIAGHPAGRFSSVTGSLRYAANRARQHIRLLDHAGTVDIFRGARPRAGWISTVTGFIQGGGPLRRDDPNSWRQFRPASPTGNAYRAGAGEARRSARSRAPSECPRNDDPSRSPARRAARVRSLRRSPSSRRRLSSVRSAPPRRQPCSSWTQRSSSAAVQRAGDLAVLFMTITAGNARCEALVLATFPGPRRGAAIVRSSSELQRDHDGVHDRKRRAGRRRIRVVGLLPAARRSPARRPLVRRVSRRSGHGRTRRAALPRPLEESIRRRQRDWAEGDSERSGAHGDRRPSSRLQGALGACVALDARADGPARDLRDTGHEPELHQRRGAAAPGERVSRVR